jgi:hypothetical protein
MKIGDVVKRLGDEKRTWIVRDFKSDSRAFWIKVVEEDLLGHDIWYEHDVWYEASCFEVVNENR